MNTVTSTIGWRGNRFVRNLHTFISSARARAVGLVFATDSLLFGSWVSHIPYVKDKLHLSDAELGMTLLGLPVGLLLMNPMTGWIVGKLGEARSCFVAVLALCFSMLVPINSPNAVVLTLGLVMVGMCNALINVAMNTAATNVEREENISIMSACHGMWSLGGMTGSGLAGLAISFHIPPPAHMLASILFVVLITFLIRPVLASIPGQITGSSGSSFIKPNLALMIMIMIGLAVSMGEGVAFDWSAVYLRDNTHATKQIAALGFASFSLTMTLGRFLGDAIIPVIGSRRILLLGGLVAASGLLLAILLPFPATSLLGFALLGAGCSLGAPILYAASMRIPGISPAAGLATFATYSFIGFLAGPPVIGFVSESYGLVYGLGIVALMLLVAAALSRKVTLHE